MRLTLGTRSVDLTTRALVVGPPGVDRPDIVEITPGGDDMPTTEPTATEDRMVAARIDGSPAALAAALDAGAVLISTADPEASVTDLFRACARTGASVVVSTPEGHFDRVRARLVDCAHQAEDTGVPCDRIVLEPPLTSALLPHLRRFAELGYPVLVTVTEPVAAALPGDRTALTALALIQGARLIRTDAVKASTRVCRVVSAILEAR